MRVYILFHGHRNNSRGDTTSNTAKKWQDDAIHFLKSREFEQLCDAIDWPWQAIRREAFVQDRNNKKEATA